MKTDNDSRLSRSSQGVEEGASCDALPSDGEPSEGAFSDDIGIGDISRLLSSCQALSAVDEEARECDRWDDLVSKDSADAVLDALKNIIGSDEKDPFDLSARFDTLNDLDVVKTPDSAAVVDETAVSSAPDSAAVVDETAVSSAPDSAAVVETAVSSALDSAAVVDETAVSSAPDSAAVVDETTVSSAPDSAAVVEETTVSSALDSAADKSLEKTEKSKCSAAKPVLPNVSSVRRTVVSPLVNHAFEGTNEVYIQSSFFETLDGTQPEASKAVEKKRPEVPKLPRGDIKKSSNGAVLNKGVKGGNVVGIVAHGGLPKAEVDASFDAAALGERPLEKTKCHPAMVQDDSEADAVFASRMNRALASGSSHKIPCASIGLPQPCLGGTQQSSKETESSFRKRVCRKIYEQIANMQMLGMGSLDIDETDIFDDEVFTRLSAALIDAQSSQTPSLHWIQSPCNMTPRLVIRSFLRGCMFRLATFTCYAPVYAQADAHTDLATALVAGRIDCFPSDSDERKGEVLLKSVESFLPVSDLRWGQNILLVRYGMGHMISKRNGDDLVQLAAQNSVDMRELLLNFIANDAKQGPVVIVLPVELYGEINEWRDILEDIRKLESRNVLVLLFGSEKARQETAALNGCNVEAFPIPDLSKECVSALLVGALMPFSFSDRFLMSIAAKACGRYDIARILSQILRIRADEIAAAQNDFTTEFDEKTSSIEGIFHLYAESFSDEQRSFMSWAALMGNVFYLGDLCRLMALADFSDEAFFDDQQSVERCNATARSLESLGELVVLGRHETRGTCFGIPAANVWRYLMESEQPEISAQIHGCYAMQLLRQNCDNHGLLQMQFSAANMWVYAAKDVLHCARTFAARFENCSALRILEVALSVIGPEYGEVYADILRVYIDVCQRVGAFENAHQMSRQLIAYLKYLGAAEACAAAMIVYAKTLYLTEPGEKSTKLLLNAIRIAEKNENDILISAGYLGLAERVFESGAKGSLVNALRYAEKSLEIRRRHHDLRRIAEVQTLCARIYMRRGEPERAIVAATEAYHAQQVSGCWFDTPKSLSVLACASHATASGLPADYLSRGVDIVKKTGDFRDKFLLHCTRAHLFCTSLERNLVKSDLSELSLMLRAQPCLPWQTQYLLVSAMFDFACRDHKKTTRTLKNFFDAAVRLNNAYLLSCGYALSAELNLDVYKRNLGEISLEKTEKLHTTATSLFESVGAWHDVAVSLRHYADFLHATHRKAEAASVGQRADRVDPYCQ